jgi:hypothetical protein
MSRRQTVLVFIVAMTVAHVIAVVAEAASIQTGASLIVLFVFAIVVGAVARMPLVVLGASVVVLQALGWGSLWYVGSRRAQADRACASAVLGDAERFARTHGGFPARIDEMYSARTPRPAMCAERQLAIWVDYVPLSAKRGCVRTRGWSRALVHLECVEHDSPSTGLSGAASP